MDNDATYHDSDDGFDDGFDANLGQEVFEAGYHHNSVNGDGSWTKISHNERDTRRYPVQVEFNSVDKLMLECLKCEAKVIVSRIKQKIGVCGMLFYF